MLSSRLCSTRAPGALFSQRAAPQRSSTVIRSRVPRLVVRASQEQDSAEKTMAEKFALPAAAILGAALLFAATPDEALAARSGGRVGGSSGFSARRSAPPARAPAASSPAVVNNYYSAPPLVGGYGFGFGMPFFGGGFGFGMPVFGISTIFNFMILSIVISVVWGVISNLTNAPRKDEKRDDEW